MRMFVVKQETNLDALSSKLLRARTPGTLASGTLERLKTLNPHVDFSQLTPGTVLLLPESPDIKDSASTSVGADTLQDLIQNVDGGIKSSNARINQGFERLSADRTAVAATLKLAVVKKMLDADPLLKKQLESADAQFKEDQKKALAAQKQLEEIQQKALEELAALERLIK